ncbi:MAG: SdpI family protein [Lachnospiraceae bacterium]|nr:SdpI family protein [Lachnospiraceae bacterium]
MSFWIFMFCCNLLIPLTMIIGGRIMLKHPPKKINGISGYRTSRSMRNMDTWHFAHETCGRLWWKTGWLILFPSIIIQLPLIRTSDNLIGIAGLLLVTIQCILLIASIFPVEKALKSKFNEDGSRK